MFAKKRLDTECYIFDRDLQTYSSRYISYNVIQEGMDQIYQFFFEAKLDRITI